MLRLLYGEMIIQKESILYHTSDDLFVYQNFHDKPFLFCTFHPSEYTGNNKYVHFIKIKKELSLLFMIDSIKNIKIYSSLNQITNVPNKNLAKKHDYVLKNVTNDLKKEDLNRIEKFIKKSSKRTRKLKNYIMTNLREAFLFDEDSYDLFLYKHNMNYESNHVQHPNQ